MNLKKSVIFCTIPISLVLASSAIRAGNSDHYVNSGGYIREATVISADPVYRTVRVNNPRQQCWDEQVRTPVKTYQSYTPEILGSIVGAAVGRGFGRGRGQDLATVAGAVLGGSIGRDVKSRRARHSDNVHYEKRCETVDSYRTEEQRDGYDVTYRYDGNVYQARTRQDPGSTIKVSVDVVPVE